MKVPLKSTPPKQTTDAGLSVEVVGVAPESVKVCAAHGMTKVCQGLKFTASGTKTANFSSHMLNGYPVPDIDIVH